MYGARLGKATSGPTNRANYLLEGYDYPHTATHSYYYPTLETRGLLIKYIFGLNICLMWNKFDMVAT